MAKVLIIYGSTSGNTELIADQIAHVLRGAKHEIKAQRVECSTPDDIGFYDCALLASPTYGHGLLQDYFVPFAKALAKVNLQGKQCAAVGVGDPRYDREHHIESATILEELLKKCGATLVMPALRISRSPMRHLDGVIAKWAETLAAKLD